MNLFCIQAWFCVPDLCAATCQVLVAKADLEISTQSRLSLSTWSFLLIPLSGMKIRGTHHYPSLVTSVNGGRIRAEKGM